MYEQYLVTPKTSAQILAESQQATAQADTSEADMHVQRAESIARPTLVALVTYFFASILILVAAEWQTILGVIGKSTSQISGNFSQQLSQQFSQYGQLQIVSWITIILFWGTVGLGVYTLFWLGSAFFTVARNELIVETAFANRGHFQERIRVPLIRLLLISALVASFGVAIRYVAPFCAQIFGYGVANVGGSLVIGLLQILVAILCAMICMYLLRTIFSYIRHADAVF